MREAVVVASSRTPLAKSQRGSFNMTLPSDLAAHCITDVLGKAARGVYPASALDNIPRVYRDYFEPAGATRNTENLMAAEAIRSLIVFRHST